VDGVEVDHYRCDEVHECSSIDLFVPIYDLDQPVDDRDERRKRNGKHKPLPS
jgi:hypothetical protein